MVLIIFWTVYLLGALVAIPRLQWLERRWRWLPYDLLACLLAFLFSLYVYAGLQRVL